MAFSLPSLLKDASVEPLKAKKIPLTVPQKEAPFLKTALEGAVKCEHIDLKGWVMFLLPTGGGGQDREGEISKHRSGQVLLNQVLKQERPSPI